MSRRPFSTYVYTALFLGTLLLLARNDAPASTFSRYFPRPPPRPSPASPCPIPWLNDTSTPAPPKALSCVPVPTNHTEFAVQLCFDSTACNQGYVQVEYLNKERCDQVERELNPSKAEEQNNYVKGKLGPHTLSVLFDGAVRDGREKPEYLGRCAYRYPYQLNNGGRFALRVVLVYEDYKGLDSIHQDKWQPIINQDILPSDFLSPLAACSPDCTRYLASDYDPSIQPLCTRDEPITGTWLPTFPSTAYNSTKSIWPVSPIKFGHFPPYQWVPRGCRLELTAMEAQKPWRERALCYGRKRRVLITGDSHSSWMRDGLMDKMGMAFEGLAPGQPHRYSKADIGKTFSIGAVSVDWINDVVLSNFRDHIDDGDTYSKYDTVILSAVQWLVHQPQHEYEQHITLLLAKIAKMKRKPHFIWFTSPAWPHRSDDTVKKENDTRTNARLTQMNEFASKSFRDAGFATVENLEASIMFSHGHESRDNAHWFVTPVMEQMHQMVIHRLDLCRV